MCFREPVHRLVKLLKNNSFFSKFLNLFGRVTYNIPEPGTELPTFDPLLNCREVHVRLIVSRGSSTVYLSDLFRKYFIKVFSHFCSLKSLRPQVGRKGKIIENTMVGISIANYIPATIPWWGFQSQNYIPGSKI